MPRTRSKNMEQVTRECTINLNKRLHRVTFKKKARRAISAIKDFARDMMGTDDVRIDPDLNKAVWAKGVRHVPKRIRVRLSRKRNDDEEAKEKFYTKVSHVDSVGKGEFRGIGGGAAGLQTRTVEEA